MMIVYDACNCEMSRIVELAGSLLYVPTATLSSCNVTSRLSQAQLRTA